MGDRLWGMAVMQMQEVERYARGGERTRVRDTLPRVVLTTPISPPVPLMHSLFSRRRRRRRQRLAAAAATAAAAAAAAATVTTTTTTMRTVCYTYRFLFPSFLSSVVPLLRVRRF